ncbi:hypothetical protein D6817_04560 [Candidatus Pacearchaeota archaeon]|nr:MAG: hypothetical protein D6817_04560 [Candidatus Pacearchaeota archaeon]
MYIRKPPFKRALNARIRARTKDNFARLPTPSAQLKAHPCNCQLRARRFQRARVPTHEGRTISNALALNSRAR